MWVGEAEPRGRYRSCQEPILARRRYHRVQEEALEEALEGEARLPEGEQLSHLAEGEASASAYLLEFPAEALSLVLVDRELAPARRR